MQFYDMHCHIDLMPSMIGFANEALKAGIGVLSVTTTPKAFEKEVEIFQSFTNIKVALGFHPQLVFERYRELNLIEKHINAAKYIGEIGLDFNKQFYASKDKQIDVFENIIKWCSKKSDKIISIHAVRADKIVLDILGKYRCPEKNKCIIHWFSGSMTQLRRAIDMKCFFSINGAMIKSINGLNLIKNIPIENILIETDAPFINDIKNIERIKTELQEIESSLVSIFGEDLLYLIHNNSKALLLLE